ncbi:S-adenosyl-L-methionine-dependent methyltransferase [Xylariaceae sp. FL0804]|nr:S-adenosyl-L-methionine-dependent methyltransferase [Xylariaceae sp. FL0804]
MATIPTPSLVAQAEAILGAATRLQEQLERNGLPQPGFEAGAPRRDWSDAAAHPDILDLRSQLIDASEVMRNLVMGPAEVVLQLAAPETATRAEVLRTLVALGVPAAVPLDGSAVPMDELARRVGACPDRLRKQLRFAYLMGLFHEPDVDMVAHTSLSAAVPGIAPWMRLRLSPLMSLGAFQLPLAMRQAAAAAAAREGSGGGSDGGDGGAALKTPFQLADPKGRDFWDALEQDGVDGYASYQHHTATNGVNGEKKKKEEGKEEKEKDEKEETGLAIFSRGMEAQLASLTANTLAPFARGFDWAGLVEDAGTTAAPLVVDVGGGSGHVVLGMLRDDDPGTPCVPPAVRFLVQDQPANEAPARANIKAAAGSAAVDGDEKAKRVDFMAHDFFAPQPADLRPAAYMLSRVLHDWKDEDCVRILKPLVPAMAQHGTRLFLAERVLPERPGEVPRHREQLMRMPDLLMYTLFGSGERTRADWERVVAAADPRLRVVAVNTSAISSLSFVEVRLV